MNAFCRDSLLQVTALGATRVTIDGRDVPQNAWRARQTRDLFFIAVDRPPMGRDEVGEMLWPALTPRQVTTNFHSARWRLNRALGKRGLYAQDPSTGQYRLDLSSAEIVYDVALFEQTVRWARRQPLNETTLAAWNSALELYSGPYLPGCTADWALVRRQHLALMYLYALLAAAELTAQLGDLERAMALYRRALAEDEYQEDAYVRLIELLVQNRRFAEARYYARQCQNELGAVPLAIDRVIAAAA